MRFLGLGFTLLLLVPVAALGQPRTSSATARAVGAAVITAPAVPSKDKSAGELVGKVVGVVDLGFVCGVRATFVELSIKGILPYAMPAAAICPGNLAATCRAFRPNQRVRLLGKLATVPDPEQPGYQACNPRSWVDFLPAYGFGVTSVPR